MIKKLLSKNSVLYRAGRFIYRLLTSSYRLIQLSTRALPIKKIREVKNDPLYNGIWEDLIAYTGFSEKRLYHYLRRKPDKHFESEFNWMHPRDRIELSWFYRCNFSYLFANSAHPYVTVLDIIKKGRVLDYGAGTGCNTIGLAKKGLVVDFIEINRLQADFIKFRARRHGLKNINEILPYYDGAYDPIRCIDQKFDAILAMDVLEHIPDYHIVLKQFIDHLKPGGLIIENSPFEPMAQDVDIHISPSIPIEQAMYGMENIGNGIWKKKI